MAKEDRLRKKQEADDKVNKQKAAGASFMSSFLSKAPGSTATSSTITQKRDSSRPRSSSVSSRESTKIDSRKPLPCIDTTFLLHAGASSSHLPRSEHFENLFKDFYEAANVTMAPLNRFMEAKKAQQDLGMENILIESADTDANIARWTAAGESSRRACPVLNLIRLSDRFFE